MIPRSLLGESMNGNVMKYKYYLTIKGFQTHVLEWKYRV